MRFFKTTNASRPYKTGGMSFTFDPVELTGGGSWLGVLAVDNETASTLTKAGFSQVKEITEQEFQDIKKKSEQTQLAPGTAKGSVSATSRKCSTCGQGGYKVYSR